MKPTLVFLTALLLAPLAALPAVDAPSLQPPQHLGPPKAEHAVTNRAFTGISSMAVAPKGRLATLTTTTMMMATPTLKPAGRPA